MTPGSGGQADGRSAARRGRGNRSKCRFLNAVGPLDEAAATAFAHACRGAAPLFLEEPVWRPEDFTAGECPARARHRAAFAAS
jgi:L-alanine-DL-glutamate epimerase-like enolase superfamily enzyme